MDAVIKKIPYGMTDFERIILENYYYVDKTYRQSRKSDLLLFLSSPSPFRKKSFPKHARFILRHQPKR